MQNFRSRASVFAWLIEELLWTTLGWTHPLLLRRPEKHDYHHQRHLGFAPAAQCKVLHCPHQVVRHAMCPQCNPQFIPAHPVEGVLEIRTYGPHVGADRQQCIHHQVHTRQVVNEVPHNNLPLVGIPLTSNRGPIIRCGVTFQFSFRSLHQSVPILVHQRCPSNNWT